MRCIGGSLRGCLVHKHASGIFCSALFLHEQSGRLESPSFHKQHRYDDTYWEHQHRRVSRNKKSLREICSSVSMKEGCQTEGHLQFAVVTYDALHVAKENALADDGAEQHADGVFLAQQGKQGVTAWSRPPGWTARRAAFLLLFLRFLGRGLKIPI